jgi:hypothetical protein
MRTALVVLVGLLAMLTAGCGATVDPDKAAANVAEVVSKNAGFTPKDVKCPSGVDAKVDSEFDCRFTGPEGPYTAHVKVKAVEGDNLIFYIQSKRS